MLLDSFDSSSQIKLVVTLVWSSSVDPAPTPCYSFLAWLFLLYVLFSFLCFSSKIFERSFSFVWLSLLRRRCLAWRFAVWRFKCFALLCWHRLVFDCPTSPVALQIDWQNNYGLDLSNRRQSGIEWAAEHKTHVFLWFFFMWGKKGRLKISHGCFPAS